MWLWPIWFVADMVVANMQGLSPSVVDPDLHCIHPLLFTSYKLHVLLLLKSNTPSTLTAHNVRLHICGQRLEISDYTT